ncbi:hypothetical protein BJV78DRAFT_1157080 [Lactifluus subvellereus]|nr:hypothetical protein BJV78DRAFT_1157080 [Lactifluus subvellereus]
MRSKSLRSERIVRTGFKETREIKFTENREGLPVGLNVSSGNEMRIRGSEAPAANLARINRSRKVRFTESKLRPRAEADALGVWKIPRSFSLPRNVAFPLQDSDKNIHGMLIAWTSPLAPTAMPDGLDGLPSFWNPSIPNAELEKNKFNLFPNASIGGPGPGRS